MEQQKIDVGQGVDVYLNIAGLGARSYAFTIDWHIRFILALAWLFAWFLFIDLNESWFDNMVGLFDDQFDTVFLIVFLPANIVYFFYHPVLEIWMKGQTPGKRMAKIRVVNQDGSIASVGTHLIRNVFRLVDSLPLFYCFGILVTLCTKQHVRLGDMAAGTLEVYVENNSQLVMDDVANFVEQGTLDPEQRQIIRDLIGRWSLLELSMRRKLGQQLLAKVNQQTEQNNIDALTDEQILSELKELL